MAKRDRSGGNAPQKKSTGRRVVTLLVVMALVVGGAGVAWKLYQDSIAYKGTGNRDADALQGRVNTLTNEQLQEELNTLVDEGMFNISIAANAIAYGSPMEAEWRIENKANNRYLMQVNVYLDENEEGAQNELIYSSNIIDPGYHIPKASTMRDLPLGEYPATAVFTGLNAETEEEVGKVNAKFSIFVLDGPLA